MRTLIIMGLAIGVAACGSGSAPANSESNAATPAPAASPTPPPAVTPTPVAQGQRPIVAIDGEGVRLVAPDSGRTRPIPFGTSRVDTLAALATRGTPATGTNSECGAGPLAWARYADGLTLNFQDDRFAGWSVDRSAGGRVTTMAGIGPGSTRTALESAYAITLPDSTLGTEFAAGDLGGLLDGPGPNARITDLWAGVTCQFR